MRSIVADREEWSVGLSVTLVNPAKTTEGIEMPFGLSTRLGQGNHVLDGGPNLPMGRGNFEGEGWPIVKYRDTLRQSGAVICAKTAEPIVMPFGLSARTGPKKHDLDGIQMPPWEGATLWERGARCKVYGFSAVRCAKRLNRSICPLGCGLGWAEGSTSSVVFARWRQCALSCGHIGAACRMRLAMEMWSYIKLLDIFPGPPFFGRRGHLNRLCHHSVHSRDIMTL